MADQDTGAGQVGAGVDTNEAKTVEVPLETVPNGTTSEASEGAGAGAEAPETTTAEAAETVEAKLPSLEDIVAPIVEVPTGSSQNEICMGPIRENVVADTNYYCLPAAWLRGWQAYVQGRSTSVPTMIDMTPLIDKITPDMVLVKKELTPGQDYEIIPEVPWKHFVKWYGYKGPEVMRVASEGTHRMPSVMLHPLTMPLSLFKYPNTVATATGTASVSQGEKKEYEIFYGFASDKVGAIKKKIAKKLKVEPTSLRLWDFYSPHQLALLDENKTLSEVNIVENNAILVEHEHPFAKKFLFEGPRSLGVGTASTTSYYNSSYSSTPSQPRQVVPGKQGLGNLGNTCFMNSGLQCLSACVPLTDFFLSQRFVSDINRDNPIGAKGLMAEAYGKLLGELWSSTQAAPSYGGGYYYHHYSYGVEPRQLKGVVERFAPQFAGYQQQDSQELLAFLLDGLHEDLNRILRKPYVEGVTGTPEDKDEEVAAKAWHGHKQRNDSFIVDHFQGQLKSKVVCPHCSNVSITFDPFMYLSLPLPIDTSRWVKCVFVPIQGLPTRHAVALKSTDSIATLFQLLTSQLNDLRLKAQQLGGPAANRPPHVLTPENTVLCELNYGAFYERKKHTDLVDSLEPRETYYVYEMHIPTPAELAAANAAAPASDDKPEEEAASDEPRPTTPKVHSYPPQDSEMEGVEMSNRGKENAAAGAAAADSDDEEEDQKGAWAYLPTTITYAETYGYSNYVTQTKAHMPLVISTPNHCTWQQLYERICMHLAPYCRNPFPRFEDVMAQYKVLVDEHAAKVADEKREREEAIRKAEQERTAAEAEAQARREAQAAAKASETADAVETAETPEADKSDGEDGEVDEVEGRGRRSPTSSDDEAARRRRLDDSDSDDERRYTNSAYRSAHHASNPYTHNTYGFNRNPAYTARSAAGQPTSYAGVAASGPPSNVPPLAPPAFPFSITVTERYRHPRALNPLMEGAIRFGSADDVSYSIAFPNKATFANYIDETLMKALEEHQSVAANLRAATGSASNAESPLPLKDCLDLFCTEEQLTEENMWYCNKCKDHVRAIKKLDIWSLPRILVIHLKRFHYGSRHRRDKITTLVQFPLENLDLSAYLLGHLEGVSEPAVAQAAPAASSSDAPTTEEAATADAAPSAEGLPTDVPALPAHLAPLYDLFAVSNHYGGMGGGHYTAYAKYRDDGTWHYYDDSSCRPSSPNDVQSTAAYVLFYHRKDVPWTPFNASIIGSAAPAAAPSPAPSSTPVSQPGVGNYYTSMTSGGGDLIHHRDSDSDGDLGTGADSDSSDDLRRHHTRRVVVVGNRTYVTNDSTDDDIRARSSDEDEEEAGSEDLSLQPSSVRHPMDDAY
jgi:ubiquitin C-terminal hydrolase